MSYKETESFKVLYKDSQSEARLSSFQTRRGSLDLPLFCPVATKGSIKSIDGEELSNLGVSMILANAYHLHLKPGEKLIKKEGGLHSFMNWSGPILTDSGGYQVFSLTNINSVTEKGVLFKSHINGDEILITPESSVQIQCDLGADIIMAFDHCPSAQISKEESRESLEQTYRWLQRSYAAYKEEVKEMKKPPLFFGILQGGMHKDLRQRSLEQVLSLELKGVAVGGMAVGESKEKREEILQFISSQLPSDQPHYLMGVGLPEDIIEAVDCGFDLFDCVLPTRQARMGKLFTWNGVINIRNSQYKEDSNPIDSNCTCLCCRSYTRAYLRHLFTSQELLSYRLNTIHNIHFYMELMKRIRAAIQNGRWQEFKKETLTQLKGIKNS